jgi:hypothetical protein
MSLANYIIDCANIIKKGTASESNPLIANTKAIGLVNIQKKMGNIPAAQIPNHIDV